MAFYDKSELQCHWLVPPLHPWKGKRNWISVWTVNAGEGWFTFTQWSGETPSPGVNTYDTRGRAMRLALGVPYPLEEGREVWRHYINSGWRPCSEAEAAGILGANWGPQPSIIQKPSAVLTAYTEPDLPF